MTALVLRGLKARPIRALLTALAVVLGVAMISGTYVLTDTINKSFTDIFATANAGINVVVSPRKVSSAFDTPPKPLSDGLIARVRGIAGVKAVDGSIFADLGSIRDAKGKRLKGFTAAASLSPAPFSSFDFRSGRAPRGGGELGLDESTFAKGNFKLGDAVTLVGAQGARTLKLVGAARFGTSDSVAGAKVAIVTLPVAQALTDHRGEVDSISVIAKPGVSDSQLRARVAAGLAGAPVTVRTGAQDAKKQASDIQSQFSFLRTALLAFAGIALFVGAFVIYNTFSITIAQRTRELALLRTLGASRTQVLRSVLLESAAIGLIGALLGLAMGLLIAKGLRGLFSLIGADLPATSSVVQTRTIIVSLLVGVGITVIASIVPAIRSTRIAPVAALRDGLTASPRSGRARIVFAALLCVGGAAVLAIGLFGGGSGGSVAAAMGAGAVAIFLGVALLSPLLVRPIAAVVGAPLERIAGVSGRLARENTVRNPGRTAATAAALMIGVALVAFVSIFAAGLKGSIDSSIDRSFAGDLSVRNSGGFGGGTPAAAALAVRAVPGVATVSAIRFSEAKVAGAKGTKSVAGVDPATLAQTYKLKWKSGSDAVLSQLGGDGVLADKGFAKNLRVGQRVSLLTPAGKHVTYTIRGVLDEGSGFGLLGGGLVVPNDRLASDFNVRDDAFVFLKYAPGANPKVVRASIDRMLKARFPDAETQDREQVKKTQAGQIDKLLTLIYALLALSVIVSLFGIVNTLALSIFERTRELGLLRAVGTSRRQVKRIVRLEAVITSLIGAALGLVLGVLFALAISRPLAKEGFTLTFPILTLLELMVGAALAGVLAAVLPARRAARLDVLRALAYE